MSSAWWRPPLRVFLPPGSRQPRVSPVTGRRHGGWAVGVQRLPLPDSWHPLRFCSHLYFTCVSLKHPLVSLLQARFRTQKRSAKSPVRCLPLAFPLPPPAPWGRAFLEVAKAQGSASPTQCRGWGRCGGSGRPGFLNTPACELGDRERQLPACWAAGPGHPPLRQCPPLAAGALVPGKVSGS